jgi:hypothetical protein
MVTAQGHHLPRKTIRSRRLRRSIVDGKNAQDWNALCTAPLEVSVKKVLAWTGLIVVVWWVVNNPDRAANFVHQVGQALTALTH